MHRSWQFWGLAAAACLVVLWAYWPGLSGGLYFDDVANIVEVPALHWEGPTWQEFRDGLSGARLPRRVVANTTFGLNHAWGGLDPRGYHKVNLAIHLLVGIALGWVAWLYGLGAGSRPEKAKPLLAAVVATLVFLVHPLNVQSVTYVVQRMTSLAALFGLLAFGAYLTARRGAAAARWRWFALAGVGWLLAAGSKETALVLPAVVVGFELSIHGSAWRRRFANWRSEGGSRWLVIVGAVGLVVAALLLWELYAEAGGVRWSERLTGREYTGWERVLTQARVQMLYLSLLLWPAPGRLSLDHQFAVSRSWLEPATLGSIFFWLVVAGVVVWLARRHPRYGFPLLAYLVLHALESGPVNLELVFEHRMYLPMAFLALLLTVLVSDLGGRRWKMALALSLIAALPLVVATRRRNVTWSDPLTLHYDCVRKAPEKPRTRNNLGSVLAQDGRHHEAVEEFLAALRLQPDYFEARVGLGKSYAAIGRSAAAEAELRLAATNWPALAMPHIELGNLYRLQKRPDEAVVEYRRALEREPQNLGASYNLGSLLVELGSVREAIPVLESVRQRDKSYAAVYRPLGDAYRLLGEGERAIAQYREALSRGDDGAELRLALGTALGEAGRFQESQVHLEQSLMLGATGSEVHNNLGIVYLQIGDAGRAMERFRAAVGIDPGNGSAHFNLSLAYRALGRIEDADESLRRARTLGVAVR